jgi:TfoX/Sxy family transcriptional regulator of competence genes
MVYDEKLADRIRRIIGKNKVVTEKNMFGGLSFLLKGKMFCGVLKEDLVLKMSHEQCEDALKKKNVRPMDFTGRPMKGFVYVNSKGSKSDKDLKRWIELSYKHAEFVDKK